MSSAARNELLPGRSRGDIDRAGERIRVWLAAPAGTETVEQIEAISLMLEYRETFQAPLNSVVMGLRSMVKSEMPNLKAAGARVPVSQRLKREIQMMIKLERFPNMDLSRMGDIGGCRAILDSRTQVDGVLRRIRKNWDVQGKVRDFRDDPPASGYRAVHVMVQRKGRLIEVQLRDRVEHSWAVAVERTGQRHGLMLKEGYGPADLVEYFRLASLGLYLDNQGVSAPAEFTAQFSAARQAVAKYFER